MVGDGGAGVGAGVLGGLAVGAIASQPYYGMAIGYPGYAYGPGYGYPGYAYNYGYPGYSYYRGPQRLQLRSLELLLSRSQGSEKAPPFWRGFFHVNAFVFSELTWIRAMRAPNGENSLH